MSVQQLRFIPNRAGFKFVGITHGGEQIKCEVKKSDDGFHFVIDDKGIPCFERLAGWVRQKGFSKQLSE